MDEKNRKKLLLGIFVAVVAVYGGRSLISSVFLDPINKASTKISSTEKTLEGLRMEELALGVARRNLDDWRAISLPEDTLNAQRLYREWIENLALKCGFTLRSVEPGGKNDQKGRYLTVAVDLKGETDLAGLSRFMYLFDQVAMLHRITSLKIGSTGTQGNPRLEVDLTAEGMSVFSSGTRNELFARTGLASAVTEAAVALEIEPTENFKDKTPFFVRINREMLQVTETDGNSWKVRRAVNGTKATAHSAGAIVEALPFQWDRLEKSFEEYSPLLAASPFALPVQPKTFSPRLIGLSDKTIKPGEEIRQTVKADDVNPALGEPIFRLVEPAEGMELNEKTGELIWKTSKDLAAGRYSSTVVMVQPEAPDRKIESRITVTVRIPNSPPVIQAADSAIVVLGQPFSHPVTATDDGPANQLTFSLGSGAQTGLSIDPKSGELKWAPPMSFKPGIYDVEVKVTDAGSEPQTASKTIKLDVRDDSAVLTLLTGAVSKDDVWYAWFRNKGTGERQELKVGDRLKVAEIDAEVAAIENRSILLSDAMGTWRVMLGNSIRQRVLVTPAQTPAPASDNPTPPSTAAAPTAADGSLTPTSLKQTVLPESEGASSSAEDRPTTEQSPEQDGGVSAEETVSPEATQSISED